MSSATTSNSTRGLNRSVKKPGMEHVEKHEGRVLSRASTKMKLEVGARDTIVTNQTNANGFGIIEIT